MVGMGLIAGEVEGVTRDKEFGAAGAVVSATGPPFKPLSVAFGLQETKENKINDKMKRVSFLYFKSECIFFIAPSQVLGVKDLSDLSEKKLDQDGVFNEFR